jgi:hypothetical protein
MWEVAEKELGPDAPDDGRVFVTDGETEFHVDRTGAQHLADLLNGKGKKKNETPVATVVRR